MQHFNSTKKVDQIDMEDLLVQMENHYGVWTKDKNEPLPQMTNHLSPYKALFQPLQVNGCLIKNRIMMGPMGSCSTMTPAGSPTQKLINFYAERAKGGVGLITSGLIPIDSSLEYVVVEKATGNSINPRLDSLPSAQGWADICLKVHAHGCKFFAQLTPGFGRVGPPFQMLQGIQAVSASPLPHAVYQNTNARELSDEELKKLIYNAGIVSYRAMLLGIDGIHLHGHEGYLLDQLTNTAFNKRTEGLYAGDKAINFAIDLVQNIRSVVGPKVPIMYRTELSAMLRISYQDHLDTDPFLQNFTNERSVKDTITFMKLLIKAGVDMLDVDLGVYETWWLPHPPTGMPPACYLKVAEFVKNELKDVKSNAGLPVPVVVVGNMGYPDIAEQALRDNCCDMVMLARPLLADPYWPRKVMANKISDIAPCIGCHRCLHELFKFSHPICAVNPRTFFEDEPHPIFTRKPQNVAIVGAGPAGITAAQFLLQRGHKVTLFCDEIGGMIRVGSVPKFKYAVRNYLTYLENTVHRLAKEDGLVVESGRRVSPEELKKKNFDTIACFTGGKVVDPPFPYSPAKTCNAVDFLRNPTKFLTPDIKNIIVAGGGEVGFDVAHTLVYEYDKTVEVVEMLPTVMESALPANSRYILHFIERTNKLKIHNGTRITQVCEDGTVKIQRSLDPDLPKPYIFWKRFSILKKTSKAFAEEEEILKGDLIIFALGSKPDCEIYTKLLDIQAAPYIVHGGDGMNPATVADATIAGYEIAKELE